MAVISISQAWRVTFIEQVRACVSPSQDHERETAERALLALLASNGGIPGSRSDEAVRQLVREVRKMYDELQSPTPEPPDTDAALRSEEDVLMDELFGRRTAEEGARDQRLATIDDDDDVDDDDAHAEFTEEDDL